MALPTVAQFSEKIDVIAVEIPISVRDRDGRVPPDLTKDDFQVFEDGVPQEVIGLSYPVAYVPAATAAAAPAPAPARTPERRWQIVVYIQESFSTTPGVREAMKGLVDQAERLAKLGDVEVVSDYPSPHAILPATADAAALRQTITTLSTHAIGHAEVRQLREAERRMPRPPMPMRANASSAELAARIEAGMIRLRQDTMLAWMARYSTPTGTPRLLLFVSDGYPLDPEYYALNAPDNEDVTGLRDASTSVRQDLLDRTLAGQGWTVYTIAPGARAPLESAMDATFSSGVHQRPKIAEALAPLQMLTGETGGKMTTDRTLVARDIDTFTERLTLTYRSRRARDGKLHRLEIRTTRPGLTVAAPHSVSSGSPETIASARATSIALKLGERGELPVTCSIVRGSAAGEEILQANVDFAPLAGARADMKSSTLRVAIGIAPQRGIPFTTVQTFQDIDMASKPGWNVAIPLRNRGGAPTAVVIEEIGTGVWGGAPCGK